MMSWDINIRGFLDSAFSPGSRRVFAVGTAFGCRGALDYGAPHVEDPERDSDSDEFNINPLRAVMDVAIYSMDLVDREGFEFEVDEVIPVSKWPPEVTGRGTEELKTCFCSVAGHGSERPPKRG